MRNDLLTHEQQNKRFHEICLSLVKSLLECIVHLQLMRPYCIEHRIQVMNMIFFAMIFDSIIIYIELHYLESFSKRMKKRCFWKKKKELWFVILRSMAINISTLQTRSYGAYLVISTRLHFYALRYL